MIAMEIAAIHTLHDDLVASIPEGVSHPKDQCPICISREEDAFSPSGGGVMSDKTYTQADIDAAVLEALKPIQRELESLRASQEAEEVERRIAEAKSEFEAKVTELQTELDTATLRADSAKKEYDDLVSFLDSEKVEQERMAEVARRREERLAVVRDVASFSDEYIEKAADRWAALSDDEFAALVEDWKAISKKESASNSNEILLPGASVMTASRETENGSSRSALREVMDLGLQRVSLADLR